jgi:hypothetical protein
MDAERSETDIPCNVMKYYWQRDEVLLKNLTLILFDKLWMNGRSPDTFILERFTVKIFYFVSA